MLLSNVTEDTFQVICNQASEIFIFSDLCHFQRPQMQIIFIQKRRLLWEEEEQRNERDFVFCTEASDMQFVTTKRTKENETPGAILRAGTTFGKSGKIECKNQSK